MQKFEVFPRFVFKRFEPVFEYGFILCDLERLDQFYSGESQGLDLLARLNATDEGQSLCEQGIIVPVPGVEPHEYTLVVRHANSETYLHNAPYISSKGWLLGTDTGNLVLSNLNNLIFWDPQDTYEYDNNYNKYETFTIAPGWYQAEFRGGINFERSDKEEWVFELILTPVQGRPDFTADLHDTNNYFHQFDQATDDFATIADLSKGTQGVKDVTEAQADNDLLLSLLSRLNTNAFEAFIMELFNDRGDPFLQLEDVGNGIFRQPLRDSYGASLDSVFLLHYLPLGIFRDPQRIGVVEDPLLARRLRKTRDFYKGKLGHFGMVSEVLVKAAKLRSLAILTNLAGIDKDYYIGDLIPQYKELTQSLDLYVPSFLVGSYDSFLDLNAGGTKEAFGRFLAKNSEGISISLNEESVHIARFTYETSFQGIFQGGKYPYEPVFANLLKQQEQILAEFEALIRAETSEAILEDFLAAHFRDIFGSNYDRIETQIWLKFPDLDIAHKDRRLDIFLRNSVVNDWELFEIKRIIPLTCTYRDIPVISSQVAYAVQQTKNYARILSQDSVKRKFAQEGIEYYEPSLNLVVGKTPQIPHEQWRWLVSSHDREVRIITFDNLLEEMKRRVKDRLEFLQVT
jgi:hypothetical protein